MAKNEAKIKFTAETGQFNDAISKSNSTLIELRSELKLNRTQMETTGKSVEGLRKEHDLLQTELKAAQDKTEALSQKLKVAVRYFGENSVEASKLRTQLSNAKTQEEKINQAINKCNKELKEQEDAFDDVGDAAKEAGTDAEKSAEGWTIVKDVIADMARDAISWAVESFKELMTAGNDALAALGASTGATTGEMERYNDVMKDVYRNNFGEDFEDISDAMSRVVQMFGDMDDASLKNITQKAIALRDTFDMDYQESLRAVNSLMDQFGITSDEAFDLIVQGAQKGLNQNDDLLDTVNEYSVQFKNAGYNAEDMFNMLKNGADTGTWSVDKLGDAVKEFNIRAKDGTVAEALKDYQEELGLSDKEVKRLTEDVKKGGKSGQTAYETILGSLTNVKDSTTKYQAGVALFGTMWEDLGETTVTSLMKTEGQISTTKNAMDEMVNTKYDTLSSALSELGRVIQSDLIQPLVDVIVPVAKDIVQWLIDHMDAIGPIIIGIATALGVLATALAISNLIKGVTAAFALLNTTMLANPITWIVAAIAGLVAAFVALWNNCEGFRNFWINLWEGIKNVFNAVVEWFKSALQWLVNIFSVAWETIKNVWSAVVGFFSGIWNGIKNVFSNVGNWFSEKFTAAKEGIKNAWANVKSFFSNVWEGTKKVFANVGNWFTEKFTAAKDGIQKAWSGMKDFFSNVWEGTKKVFANVGDWFTEKFTAAKDGIQKAWSGMKGFFSNVWKGIKQTFSNVDGWMTDKFGSAWTGIKKAFSPFVSFFKQLWESVKGIFSAVKSVLTGNFSDAWASIKGVFSGWGNFFSNLWQQVKNAFANAAKSMAEIGKNIVRGIWDGISGAASWLWNKITGFGNNVLGWFKGIFGIHSPSTETAWQGEMLVAGYINSIKAGRKEMETAMQDFASAGLNAVEWNMNTTGTVNGLHDHVSEATEKKAGMMNLQALAESINNLANRPVQLNVNGRQFALATASDGDNVNGMRSTFKNRGLVLD